MFDDDNTILRRRTRCETTAANADATTEVDVRPTVGRSHAGRRSRGSGGSRCCGPPFRRPVVSRRRTTESSMCCPLRLPRRRPGRRYAAGAADKAPSRSRAPRRRAGGGSRKRSVVRVHAAIPRPQPLRGTAPPASSRPAPLRPPRRSPAADRDPRADSPSAFLPAGSRADPACPLCLETDGPPAQTDTNH